MRCHAGDGWNLVAMGSGGHDNRPTLKEKSNAGAPPECRQWGERIFRKKRANRSSPGGDISVAQP